MRMRKYRIEGHDENALIMRAFKMIDSHADGARMCLYLYLSRYVGNIRKDAIVYNQKEDIATIRYAGVEYCCTPIGPHFTEGRQ